MITAAALVPETAIVVADSTVVEVVEFVFGIIFHFLNNIRKDYKNQNYVSILFKMVYPVSQVLHFVPSYHFHSVQCNTCQVGKGTALTVK